jgi:hypothetical protein
LRTAIGAVFLLCQLGMIAYARFVPTRYFCWAPYDTQTAYELKVSIEDRELSPQEIRARYRRPAKGRDNRSPHHVMDIVRQYEETYGRGDDARVVMTYSVNGRPEEQWKWPPR